MSRIIDKYPRSTPWLAGSIAAALMLLTSFLEARSFVARVLESLVVGALLFFFIRAIRMKPSDNSESR